MAHIFKKRCIRSCVRSNFIKAESNGYRATFYFPGGGTYKGGWLNSEHHFYGVKTDKNGRVYDGQWVHGKRQGWGTMRRHLPDRKQERTYVGEWFNDMKHGEGKQYYPDGIYYGWWKKGERDGLGIMWYNDGTMYMGEWQMNVFHGLGVFFYKNGNRYEGHFACGLKNGEGTFYHMHTGQIQKGMWEDDACRTSIMQDDFRNQVDNPTPYPIPRCRLANADKFVHDIFQKYIANANKEPDPLKASKCLQFVHKIKHLARLYPSTTPISSYDFKDVDYPCTCKKRELNISQI